MKKIYQTPEVALWQVDTTTIIADSETQIDIDPTKPPVGDGEGNYVKGRGRVGDVWADDWSK